jgi:hypothetical protein
MRPPLVTGATSVLSWVPISKALWAATTLELRERGRGAHSATRKPVDAARLLASRRPSLGRRHGESFYCTERFSPALA